MRIEGTSPIGDKITVLRFECDHCHVLMKPYTAQQEGCTGCGGMRFSITYVEKEKLEKGE